jgi:oligopeptide transport system substrate-binding protein
MLSPMRRALLVAGVLLVAGLALALTRRGVEAPADFRFINGTDVATLDPQRVSWMQDLRLSRLLFEGLVAIDPWSWDARVVPAAAERWEVSDDGLVYTFQLRPGLAWSNAEPVRAQDFVYAWRRSLLPDTAADFSGFAMLIRGGSAFFAWRERELASLAGPGWTSLPASERRRRADDLWERTLRRFDETVAVTAIDDRTLRVELEHPTPYFLELLAFPVFFPVHPPLVSRYEPISAETGRVEVRAGWTRPPAIVGNGPFVLTSWRFKRSLRLDANPRYWNRGALALRSMEVVAVVDPGAQVLAFETGAVDWCADVSAAYRGDMVARKRGFLAEHAAEVERLAAMGLDQFEIDRRLPADPRRSIHAIPTFGTYWYNFNCLPRLHDGRENPLADPRVRRALAMAIDKEALARDVRRLGEPAAGTIIPPGSIPGYRSPSGLDFDPARARALLAEAGWPDPARFPALTILFNKDSGHDLVAQAVARDWSRHLGVRVALEPMEVKVFRERLKNADYMVSRAGWYGDYADPTTFLDPHRTGDGNNDRKYSSTRYDALLDHAARRRDPDARLRLLEEAERMLVEEDLPLVPLFHYVTLYLFDPGRVTGLSAQPMLSQDLSRIDVLGDGIGPDLPRPMERRPPAARREP